MCEYVYVCVCAFVCVCCVCVLSVCVQAILNGVKAMHSLKELFHTEGISVKTA